MGSQEQRIMPPVIIDSEGHLISFPTPPLVLEPHFINFVENWNDGMMDLNEYRKDTFLTEKRTIFNF